MSIFHLIVPRPNCTCKPNRKCITWALQHLPHDMSQLGELLHHRPFWNVNMHQSCAHSFIYINCSVFTTIHYWLKEVLVIHLCPGIHLSDGLCLVPHINNLRTVSFNVSASLFQFKTKFSLRVRIVLLKLTWRGIKSFRRSYNLVLHIAQGAKAPAVITNSFFRWKIISI